MPERWHSFNLVVIDLTLSHVYPSELRWFLYSPFLCVQLLFRVVFAVDNWLAFFTFSLLNPFIQTFCALVRSWIPFRSVVIEFNTCV